MSGESNSAIACSRSITFIIPGNGIAPDVQVRAVESGGNIDFTVKVLGGGTLTADLRGLFFDVNDLSKFEGLSATGGLLTDFDTFDVIDLGNGANLLGAAMPFDVGLEFGTQGIGKDDIQSATFVLSNTAGNLTLDDIANTEFGARLTSVGVPGGHRGGSAKLTVIAPAAPDASDDAYSIFEDGQSGLNDPSSVPEGVLFEVLANDTDADGDTLVVTHVGGAEHGTVAIVDGADPDLLPGDAVLYTPDEDYAGPDSFTYCIYDNNGGTDFANVAVSIEAVADVPELDVEVLAGTAVNEIVLRVTAAQTDADSSEYIDRILTNSVPEGVTLAPVSVDPSAQPDEIYQEYLLTLPLDADSAFDLIFTAVSKETSNGDEETASETIAVVYEYNSTTESVGFAANDQSIWETGAQFTFVDDRFLGIDTGPFEEQIGSVLYAGIEGHIKLGFQSTLTFEGGEIDALATYDVLVETNYNKTVDRLLIDTSAMLTAASFDTEGPEGSYVLDFIYDVLLAAYAGVDIDFGEIDFGIGTLDLGGIHEQINLPTVGIGPGDFNVLDLDSDSLSGAVSFPPPLNAFSVNFAWPSIATSGGFPPNPAVASGASNNFLELVLDLDTLVTQLLGLPVNPLDPPRIDLGPIFADFELLDLDVIGGLNFLQQFEMQMGGLSGLLLFEDGSFQAFAIGDSLLIDDAMQKDAAGDGDGLVEFGFALVPSATLNNDTDLGFNIGVALKVFTLQLGYDIEIWNPFGDNVHLSDSIPIGPLAQFSGSAPLGDINVFDDTFALNFGPAEVWFVS